MKQIGFVLKALWEYLTLPYTIERELIEQTTAIHAAAMRKIMAAAEKANRPKGFAA